MQRGKFITFEGSEGCGKSTQIRRFVEALKNQGIEALTTREPGGTVIGEKIRHLLQYDKDAGDLTDESELLLFAASRAQLVRNVIQPALEKGTWVVADRFLDSTTVYQGIGRGLDVAAVKAINSFAVGECLPDLTLLLDLDVEVGHARALAASGESEDRMESQPMEFFRKVRQGYLDLAAEEPERIAVVDASATIDEVTEAIQAEFARRMEGVFS
jgi:dTMP kinase